MKISFVIPTRKREAILRVTLHHLVEALDTSKNEVIVVNDDLENLNLQNEFQNVKFFNNPSRGVSTARNFGASQANGDLLVFLDDDMLLDKNIILKISDYHSKDCLKSYMFSWEYPVDLYNRIKNTNFGRFLIENSYTSLRGWMGKEVEWQNDEPFQIFSAATGCLVLHKKVYEKVNGFNEKLTAYEDYDLAQRLMKIGVKFYLCPKEVIYHNELDKLNMHTFLSRRYNVMLGRKIAVEEGLTHLALNYSTIKKSLLHLIWLSKPLLLVLTRFFSNQFFYNMYSFTLKMLIPAYIYAGYHRINYNPKF